MTTCRVPVSLGSAQVRRRWRLAERSDSVRGGPSSRVSLVKIANIDLSRGSKTFQVTLYPVENLLLTGWQTHHAPLPGKDLAKQPVATGMPAPG
jgi:hypothetical protein